VPKKATKLTAREKIVLAAWFARSNMGQPRAKREEVERLLNAKWDVTLDGATIFFCEQFMETNEHERIFYGEARSWRTTLNREYTTREAVLKVWPDVEAYFWPKEGGAK
jgi:hypothetical protein